jgi:colanic acid biosynthesis glycosyl transferase WcaI
VKLVFVNRYFYPDLSATSQLLSDAAFDFSAKGYDVHIVTSRLVYNDHSLRVSRQEELNGVKVHRIWSSGFGRSKLIGRVVDYLTFYVSVLLKLIFLLQPGDTVIAKTDPPLLSVPVGWAAQFTQANLANWLQDLFPEISQALGIKLPGFLRSLLYKFRNNSLQRATMNVVIGEKMMAHLIEQGIEEKRIMVIHNWANGDEIVPRSGYNSLREEWELQRSFVVGYSGNLGRAHEINTLFRAVRRLNVDHPGVTFLFVGGGALMDLLKGQVFYNNLTNCVFKPYQPRASLPQSLTVPDLHLTILRSELEGLIVPSKFYGVLAAGKPSIFIGDQNGEIGSLIQKHDIGLCVQEGDDRDLVAKILRLKESPARSKKMGENARHLFDQQFSAEKALKKLEQAFC